MDEFLAQAFQTDRNIQAVGDGLSGKKVMYVLKKEDAAPYIARDDSIEVIECDGFGIGPPYWPEVETREYTNPKKRSRPFYGGHSIANKDVTAGTTTGKFRDKVTGDLYVASNNHVLANVNRAAIGSAILQPGPADGGNNPGDIVATLSRYGKIENGATIDAAIGKLIRPDDLDLNIISIGYIHGICEPYPGQRAKKMGRTTELTRGDVVVINASVRVNYGTREYTIEDCIITGVPSAPGDSGSPVVDFAGNLLVGFLFAGGITNDGFGITVLCKASNVMEQLGIEPVPVPEMQKAFWLDLSHWQGDIKTLSDDMTGQFKANIEGLTAESFSQMVAAGVYGVVIKAAQGQDVIDPKFEDYYAKAKAVGLKVAAYDFVDPQHSANEHFANWQRAVGDKEFSFVAMDCEAASGQSKQTITAVIQQFGALLDEQYNKKTWIYTSPGFWNQWVLPWSGWTEYPLWVAFWSDVAFSPLLPDAWKGTTGAPAMWQFIVSDSGAYLGVASKQVDLNTMYPSGLALIGGTTPPPPGKSKLTISIVGSGFVSPSGGDYDTGTVVSLTATPDTGWKFLHWEGSIIGSDNPITVVMNSDKTITAVFEEDTGSDLATGEHFLGVTTVGGLRVRSDVGTDKPIVAVLPLNQQVEIMETKKDKFGNDWVRIGYKQWSAQLYQGKEYIHYLLKKFL